MTYVNLDSFPEGHLYVMQGRLSSPEGGHFQSFPRSSWRDEFDRARAASLQGIEWIFDSYGMGANPLEDSLGRKTLMTLLEAKKVRVRSVCADYFMDHLFSDSTGTESSESFEKLKWLIDSCAELGVDRIVLPFVDSARIHKSAQKDKLLSIMMNAFPFAYGRSVELHIESDMSPEDFSSFLQHLPAVTFKVNYDAGNSAALGFRPFDEFSSYGDRIGSFHVKDRKIGGGTVPLGEGDTDFRSLRAALVDINYVGDFVLQVARGVAGDETRWVKSYGFAVSSWLRGERALPSIQDIDR